MLATAWDGDRRSSRPTASEIAFVWVKGARRGAIFAIRLTKPTQAPDGAASPSGHVINRLTVNTDGSGVARITHEAGGTFNGDFNSCSPDGAKIAFASNRFGTYEISTLDTDGAGVTPLTTGPDAAPGARANLAAADPETIGT